MSKSILVIDTPENCAECPCADDCTELCLPTDRLILEANGECEKPDWCPLKEIPPKDTFDYLINERMNGYAEGWNACIDKILEEGEGE